MVDRCAYLLLGEDEDSKQEKIDSLKAQHLDKDLKHIDFEVVYCQDKILTPPKFDEALSYLSSNKAKKRILLVKDIEALGKENRDILLKHLNAPSKSLLLILESKKLEAGSSFVKQLEPFVKVVGFKNPEKSGVFVLTRAMVSKKTTQAVRILNTLLRNREKPENILGAMFWQWNEVREKLELDKFKRGLKLLLDADIRIKTGKHDKELALEMAVIRLSDLI